MDISASAGIAVLLLHGSEARAEERPVRNEAQERPAPVSNDSTAKWRLYTDQAAKFGAQVRECSQLCSLS